MSILVDKAWIRDLGPAVAHLYSLIVSVSDKDGLSCKTNEYFIEKCGAASITTLQARLKGLEEKGWISRKLISGKKRIISINP